MNNIKSTQDIF